MNIFSSEIQYSENKEVTHPLLQEAKVSLFVKREDAIHKEVSGNKFRKLKYNLLEAQKKGYDKLLTFGGAYSNHIAATAAAGKIMGLDTIGVIRGEELGDDLKKTLSKNSTLALASQQGMQFEFVSRSMYRNKMDSSFLKNLKGKFGEFYIIPEGGTNQLAVQGCQEILCPDDKEFDVICCAVGTGGTISGIINSSCDHQKVLGFPALKGDFLNNEIKKYTFRDNWKLISDYHFGGYAKVHTELIDFMNRFKREQQIVLDPVYTAKMVFGIFDLIQNGFFRKNTRILAIHTGGLQGILGMNEILKKKNLPTIEI